MKNERAHHSMPPFAQGASGDGGSRRAGDDEDGSGPDRAGEILVMLEREPGDRLTCMRVFGTFCCNWWARGSGGGSAAADVRMNRGLEVSTYRVRKSRLIKATFGDGQLVIEDATRTAAP
jgi:hypothetical protein